VARANFRKAHVEYSNSLYKEQNYQTCVCFLMTQTRLKDMVTAMVMVAKKTMVKKDIKNIVDSNDILISNKATK
jgi:hypothetical protein